MSVNEPARLHSEGGTIRILYRPALDFHGNRVRGLYIASLGSRDLCVASDPLVAAANVLLSEGVDPATIITGRPIEVGWDVVTMTVGAAASWPTEDFDNVVRIFRRRAAR